MPTAIFPISLTLPHRARLISSLRCGLHISSALPAAAASAGAPTGAVPAARAHPVCATVASDLCPDLRFTFAANRLARLAPGAVTLQAGPTTLLATLCRQPSEAETRSRRGGGNGGVLPLVVDFRERAGARGVIPGSFYRNEGAASGPEVVTSRLVDRALRGVVGQWVREHGVDVGGGLHLVITVLSGEGAGNARGVDAMAVNAGMAAAVLAGMCGPEEAVGCARVAGVPGEGVVGFPGENVLAETDVNCVVGAGRKGLVALGMDGEEVEERRLMQVVEQGVKLAKEFREGIWELSEKMERLREREGRSDFGRVYVKRKRVEDVEKNSVAEGGNEELHKRRMQVMRKMAEEEFLECFHDCRKYPGKSHRAACVTAAHERFYERVNGLYADNLSAVPSDEVLADIVNCTSRAVFRKTMLNTKRRLDGRSMGAVRPLRCQGGILPGAVHGSGLFERGDTQVLANATFGLPYQSQRFDPYIQEVQKSFIVHYGFPHLAIGEGDRMRAPNRREIGHSDLVERALKKAIPEDFPYAVRVACTTLGSDGSSSMATVSAATVALMDAGVPLKYPVVGVAMGAVFGDDAVAEGTSGRVEYLTDLLGVEDYFGDIDLKVCGTRSCLTAIQLDVKLPGGISMHVLREALMRAQKARGTILDELESALNCSEERQETNRDNIFSESDGRRRHAHEKLTKPEIRTMQLQREAVKALLSERAALLKHLEAVSGARVTVLPTGRLSEIRVEAARASDMKKAMSILGRIEQNGVKTMRACVGDEGEALVLRFVDAYNAIVRMDGVRGMLEVGKEEVKIGQKVKVQIVETPDTNGEQIRFKRVAEDASWMQSYRNL